MARNISGLPYFSLDVNLSDKVRLLEAEYGLKGFALYIHLLQHIYGGRGYYTEWNKDVELLFAQERNASLSFVSEIVSACLRRGIFDDAIYKLYGVLTNKEIQDNFFNAVQRRKEICIIEEILLIDPYEKLKNVHINVESVDNYGKNVNSKSHRIRKDMKEDIYNGYDDKGCEASEAEDEEEQEIIDMLDEASRAKLAVKLEGFIRAYWCRSLNAYDVGRAASVLHILFLKNHKPFKELNDEHIQLLEEALMIAADADVKKWSYVSGIFRKWGNAKVFTYNDFVNFNMSLPKKRSKQ